MTTVLALETSCDESAAALVERDPQGRIAVLAHAVASQVEEHARWGGVVPELASRRHVEALPVLLERIDAAAALRAGRVQAVAATVAPGLSGALLVGSVTGRTLARLYGLPFLGMHHLEGHLCSVRLGERTPSLPHLVLLVSGGHTELIRVDGPGRFERLGRSHDDAAGEAFDKVARLLGLGYPGGPAIQAAAELGDPARFRLPRGRVSRPEGGHYPYDFSFSGLKTAMVRLVQQLREESAAAGEAALPVADLAASFEQVVADVLVERACRCARDHNLYSLVLVGGVAANRRLRALLQSRAAAQDLDVHAAPLAYCTDNAAMIGVAALDRLSGHPSGSALELGVSARLPLDRAESLYAEPPPF
ncbi:tRNA (adenosine(37)-N6)-threonylcarbamoyltransferase complex transferase subunit TsaD [Synechococcus sp. RSCCF101]|uniref:tRNA (adenosine(37)-N6)-threonylcarbamoyltransferase complex transferase subunit TsaD n=1 Tax=Synechococcus sp. RSCCF101 TaxID=2511069 RepID=UPI00124512AE|nr:tRNA (adenosine(37)-N6)-threonylcarbamoyltransferase complex transferase subunit TsaD [Synechococcus sp. RSCCF101]QEY30968.1 tRNA (adenosine(37)-N6)-threonylcarbamoyltransferase complex transferase subunit TsaD [Synechococcus sp. RSCCF101]